jgi:SCY1-like protein 1
VKKESYRALQALPPGVADAYALAILINTVFNLTTTPPATTQPPHAPLSASARGGIPPTIFPLVKKLFNPNPKIRMTCQAFLEIGMGERAGVEGVSGRFFVDNHLVSVCSKLEGFPLASDGEKAEFLRHVYPSSWSFGSIDSCV